MLSCFVVVATNLHDKRRIQDEYLLTSSDSLPARHTTEQSTRGIGGGGGGEAGVLFALATRCLAAGSVRDAARWLHAVPARHAAHVVPAPRLRGCTPRGLTGCTPRCLTGCTTHAPLPHGLRRAQRAAPGRRTGCAKTHPHPSKNSRHAGKSGGGVAPEITLGPSRVIWGWQSPVRK